MVKNKVKGLITALLWIFIIFCFSSLIGNQSNIRNIINNHITKQVSANKAFLNEIKDDNDELKKFISDLDKKDVTHILQRYGVNKALAYKYLVQNYLKKDDYTSCPKYAKKLVKFQENSYENYILYGDCMLGLEDAEKAFDAYYKAWQIYPIAPGLIQRVLPLIKDHKDISQDNLIYIYNSYPFYNLYDLQFYFSDTKDFSAEKMVTVKNIVANGNFHTYTIHFNPTMINYLRIDPLQQKNIDGLIFEIKNITFYSDTLPNLIISDFSNWDAIYDIEKTDDNNFVILGNSPYIKSPKVEINGYDSASINFKIYKDYDAI